MYNKRKDSSGIITVFLTLMLIPLLALGTLVMEVGRYMSAKEMIAEAQVTASMSILADYNVYFQERFGLLAIDPNDKQQEHFLESLRYNTDNVNTITSSPSKLVNLDEDKIKFESIFTLSDFNVLKRQILEYSKYSVPYTILNESLDLKDKILSPDFIAKLTGIDTKLLSKMLEKTERAATGIEKAFKDLGAYECAVLDIRNFFGESNTSANYKSQDLYNEYIKEDGFLGFIGGDNKEPIIYNEKTNYYNRYRKYMDLIYDKQEYLNTHEDPASDVEAAQKAYNSFTYSKPTSESRLLAEIAIYQYVSNTDNEGATITAFTKENVSISEKRYTYSTDSNSVSEVKSSSEGHSVKIADAIDLVGDYHNVPQSTLDKITTYELLNDFADAYDINATLSSTNKSTLSKYYGNQNKKTALGDLLDAQKERKKKFDEDVAKYNTDIDNAASGYKSALDTAHSKFKTLSDTIIPAITSLEIAADEFANSTSVEIADGVAIDTGVKEDTSNAGEVLAAIKNTITFLQNIKDGGKLTEAMNLISTIKTNVSQTSGSAITSVKATNNINYINGSNKALGVENDKLKGFVSKDFSKIEALCSVKAINTGNTINIQDNLNLDYNFGISTIWSFFDQIFNTLTPIPAVYNADYIVQLDSGTVGLFPKNTKSESYDEDQAYIKSIYDDVERVLGEAYANQLKDINASNIDRNDFATKVQELKEKIEEIKNAGKNLFSEGLLKAGKKLLELMGKLWEAVELTVGLMGTLIDFFATLATQSYYAALVNTYIVQKFPSRLNSIDGATTYPTEITTPKANHGYFSSACVEYAVIGKESEISNQSAVFWIIFGIRALINCIQILLDKEAMSLISGCNMLAPVVFLGFLYMETNIDTNYLMRLGEGVPLIKGNLHLSAQGMKNLIDKMASLDGAFVTIASSGNGKKFHHIDGCPTLHKGYTTISKAQALKDKREPCKRCKPGKGKGEDDDFLELDYDKYLWLLLFLISGDTKLQRIANLAQMETRYYEYEQTATQSNFLLKDAGTYIRSEVTVSYDSLLPVISLGKNTNTFLDIYNLEYVGY